MVVWTYFYEPFVMGGSVYQPKGFEFTPGKKMDLGKGYSGYQATSPAGTIIIVEKTSGGIIGSPVEMVRQDIAEADENVMARQVENACKEAKRVRLISEDEFWRIYEKGGNT